ncbi:RNA helicase [Encephalitozoon hellem]|uniref:RNA helicase n=1 Tax=Encephalitozoon hellem TaxID=27973 RepID=A0ABY8CPA0_ENCHE|nr:RNA helicase [Encephalitozoon hellem]
MERVTGISDLLEKCKDKAFVNDNKEWIRENMMKPPLKDQVMALLGTKKNIIAIRAIEAVDAPADELAPVLEDRKNINQYVYSTYYYMYKMGLIGKDRFDGAKEYFRCMKNYEKMFIDTENSFIISRIEADRRRDKVVKREFNKVVDTKEELRSLLIELPEITMGEVRKIRDGISSVKSTFVIDLDPIFDISGLRCQAKEEASRRISEIRDVLFCIDSKPSRIFTLGALGEEEGEGNSEAPVLRNLKKDKYQRFERIFNGPEKSKFTCTPLFYSVDRLLRNRITRLYDSVVKLHRTKQSVYFMSSRPLPQILAELLFFEYSSLDIRTVISTADASFDIHREVQKKEGVRVVAVGSSPLAKQEGENIYRIGYEDFRKMVDGILLMENSIERSGEGL